MHRVLPALVLVLTSLPSLADDALRLTSGVQAPVVIELFTSQGCSSCPPAERWLSRLAEEPGLWTEVIALSWHVDYWNDLGWKDVFSRPQYSQRQRDYARAGGLSQVYTPGILRDGHEWRQWRAGAAWQRKPGAAIGVLSLQVDGQTGALRFEPVAGAPTAPLTGHIAILGLGHVTAITRGENRGRTLQEDFVVLATEQGPMQDNTAVVPLPQVSDISADKRAIVAWLSQGRNPAPLQAVAGWYPAQR